MWFPTPPVAWLHVQVHAEWTLLASFVKECLPVTLCLSHGPPGVNSRHHTCTSLSPWCPPPLVQIAICAKAHNKPFYVAAESYKFARLYPLNQQDLPVELKPLDVTPLLPPKVGCLAGRQAACLVLMLVNLMRGVLVACMCGVREGRQVQGD